MNEFAKFLHLASAIIWLGGMAFVLAALRPAVTTLLPPPLRLPLLTRALSRFFVMVWICIALLLSTGSHWLASVGMRSAPLGWHLMLGAGVLMCLIFAQIYFGPFRRLKSAVLASDWPEGARLAGQVARLVTVNFVLGWLAIAAVVFLK
jgi:uncharacterized membrane protein